jgi:hypothetical protein
MLQELTFRVGLCGGVTLSAHRILSSCVKLCLFWVPSSLPYVYMYVCMYVHTHARTHTRAHAHTHIFCEVCVFHVRVAKLDFSLLNLASHLQQENKKYLFCCKYARQRPLSEPRLNYVKIGVQEVGYVVNYLKLLCNGIYGCLSYVSLGSIMTWMYWFQERHTVCLVIIVKIFIYVTVCL